MSKRYPGALLHPSDQPAPLRLRHRSSRRALVVAMLLCIGLIACVAALAGDRVWWLVVATIPAALLATVLNQSVRDILDRDDRYLDKRLLAARQRAYRTAYGYILSLVALTVAISASLTLSREEIFALAIFALLASALAPRLLLAWYLPDETFRR